MEIWYRTEESDYPILSNLSIKKVNVLKVYSDSLLIESFFKGEKIVSTRKISSNVYNYFPTFTEARGYLLNKYEHLLFEQNTIIKKYTELYNELYKLTENEIN